VNIIETMKDRKNVLNKNLILSVFNNYN